MWNFSVSQATTSTVFPNDTAKCHLRPRDQLRDFRFIMTVKTYKNITYPTSSTCGSKNTTKGETSPISSPTNNWLGWPRSRVGDSRPETCVSFLMWKCYTLRWTKHRTPLRAAQIDRVYSVAWQRCPVRSTTARGFWLQLVFDDVEVDNRCITVKLPNLKRLLVNFARLATVICHDLISMTADGIEDF